MDNPIFLPGDDDLLHDCTMVTVYDIRYIPDKRWVGFGLCFKVGFVPSVDPDNSI